ncbi:MAG TPA: hypothetical protein PKY35_00205 [Candidatus Hydrogenedentes bacterium]|nr:hypothetical protein [Candidatus Hydrogenedentota bacterium]HOL75423.1 hypothetical protein [Candidatus Hydrogenedentota bacterium]HPO84932.1 hypothetical protein [Candidatus Hydrogenedentota bacterium]
MTFLGIILTLIGILGALIVFGGFYRFPSPMNNLQSWIIVAVVGVVLYILTRRPMD